MVGSTRCRRIQPDNPGLQVEFIHLIKNSSEARDSTDILVIHGSTGIIVETNGKGELPLSSLFSLRAHACDITRSHFVMSGHLNRASRSSLVNKTGHDEIVP
jgi:hypothetical protein